MTAGVLDQLVREVSPTVGSLHLVLRMDLGSVDEVALIAAAHLGQPDGSDAMLMLAMATGRERLDVLEDLEAHQPTDLDEVAVRLALIEATLESDFTEFDIHSIAHRFGFPADMERAGALDPSRFGDSYRGLRAETLEVRDNLRTRLVSTSPQDHGG